MRWSEACQRFKVKVSLVQPQRRGERGETGPPLERGSKDGPVWILVRSAAAVDPAAAAEHAVAGGAPVFPGGGSAHTVEAGLQPGFIHIGSERQAAKARGAGFIKNLLKHSDNLLFH